LNVGYRQLLKEKTHGQFEKENIQQDTVEDLKGLSIQHGFKQDRVDYACSQNKRSPKINNQKAHDDFDGQFGFPLWGTKSRFPLKAKQIHCIRFVKYVVDGSKSLHGDEEYVYFSPKKK